MNNFKEMGDNPLRWKSKWTTSATNEFVNTMNMLNPEAYTLEGKTSEWLFHYLAKCIGFDIYFSVLNTKETHNFKGMHPYMVGFLDELQKQKDFAELRTG
jgi:hypothetical protein